MVPPLERAAGASVGLQRQARHVGAEPHQHLAVARPHGDGLERHRLAVPGGVPADVQLRVAVVGRAPRGARPAAEPDVRVRGPRVRDRDHDLVPVAGVAPLLRDDPAEFVGVGHDLEAELLDGLHAGDPDRDGTRRARRVEHAGAVLEVVAGGAGRGLVHALRAVPVLRVVVARALGVLARAVLEHLAGGAARGLVDALAPVPVLLAEVALGGPAVGGGVRVEVLHLPAARGEGKGGGHEGQGKELVHHVLHAQAKAQVSRSVSGRKHPTLFPTFCQGA